MLAGVDIHIAKPVQPTGLLTPSAFPLRLRYDLRAVASSVSRAVSSGVSAAPDSRQRRRCTSPDSRFAHVGKETDKLPIAAEVRRLQGAARQMKGLRDLATRLKDEP